VNDVARRDAGAIVMGWLVKIALVLAILGISAFDGIACASAHLMTTDDANTAASAAAAEYQTTHSLQAALAAAESAISNPSEALDPKSLSIAEDGSATVTIERKVTTLVMYRIGPLKKYTDIKVRGQASPPTR
jgi:hypothetical protein